MALSFDFMTSPPPIALHWQGI